MDRIVLELSVRQAVVLCQLAARLRSESPELFRQLEAPALRVAAALQEASVRLDQGRIVGQRPGASLWIEFFPEVAEDLRDALFTVSRLRRVDEQVLPATGIAVRIDQQLLGLEEFRATG